MPPENLPMACHGQATIKSSDRCQFLELPGEIRNEVYSYLVPDLNHAYSAELRLSPSGTPQWSLFWKPDLDAQEQEEIGQPGDHMAINMDLLTLNRQISIEARGFLYGPYAEDILTSGKRHRPTDAHILSLFGRTDRLRRLQLELDFGNADHTAMKNLRLRIESFIGSAVRDIGGADQILRLEQLTVQFPPTPASAIRLSEAFWTERKYLFCLEGLSRLRSSKTLTVITDPAWLGQCLTLCVRGEGGRLHKAEWLQITESFSPRLHTRATFSRPSKQDWYPKFNWRLFASNNNITSFDRHSQWLKYLKE